LLGRRNSPGLALSVALAVTLGSTRAARAQVNVEPLRAQVAKTGFGARVSASAASYAGNTQGVIFGSSASVGLHTNRNVEYAVLTGDYTRLNDVVSVAKWFAHARHNYRILSWFWWEEYAQIESDRFRRVTLRELVGTGPRFALFRDDTWEIFYGASYLFEHKQLDTASRNTRGEGAAHRFSNYVALTLRAEPNISFTSVTYAQPRFDDFSDVTLLSVTSAEFKITGRLRSRMDVTVRYDAVTPPDVKHADLELKSALELLF
jgi:hypothetical protein